MKFECTKCHYVTDKETMPKRCPYCGKDGVMGKAAVAQDILEEVERDTTVLPK